MTGPDPGTKQRLLDYLRKNHPDICRHWFDFIDPVEIRDGTLIMYVPEDVQLKFLRRCCTEQFREAAQAATGLLLSVEFVGDEGAVRAEPHASRSNVVAPEHAREPSTIGTDELVLSPDYAFETFIVGPDNRLAHAAAIAVARKPGTAYNPLFLHAGVGLGKTHLLQAICRATIRERPETRIAYLSCEDFMTEFLAAVQEGRMSSFRHKFRNVDILVIDDIHDLARREQTQEEFFHTFNALYQAGRQIVLSSDAPPNEIPALEERLTSRFNCGLVARLDKPCFETRVEIVKSKAKLRGIEMPDDVANYVAARIDTNIRELEGAITRIQGLAAIDGVAITSGLARQALGDQDPETTSAQPTVQAIIESVARYFDLKVTDLLSRRKHKSIAIPRQIGMWLARRHTRYSLEEIGSYFGGRDHTTVMHAVKQIESKQTLDEVLAEDVRRLEQVVTDGRGGEARTSA